MYLRDLKEKDASLMLSWMHDENVTNSLGKDFKNMKIDNCIDFIKNSLSNKEKERNFAICDEDDSYLGTVSLKNINYKDENAEYAIAMRSVAMGKGVSMYATKEIIRIAFEELNLNRVYLNVGSDNLRAIKFYNKVGFTYEGEFRKHLKSPDGKSYRDLQWFSILKEEFER